MGFPYLRLPMKLLWRFLPVEPEVTWMVMVYSQTERRTRLPRRQVAGSSGFGGFPREKPSQ